MRTSALASLNALFDAWQGDSDADRLLSIARAGVLVHATRWPGLPGPPPGETGFRHFSVLRTESGGHAPTDTPVGLTLLNRGLSELLGRNSVALESWAWEDIPTMPNVTIVPKARPDSSPIPLAATGLADEDIMCGIARDGMTSLRERGCGCTQSLRRAGPALKYAFPLSELYDNIGRIRSSRGEAEFTGRNEWGRCQHGGVFDCDALHPPGLHRSALDGNCMSELTPPGRSSWQRQCGSSLCAWRSSQGAQMLRAQVDIVRARRSGTLETLLVRAPPHL